jgi:hypothetical protein
MITITFHIFELLFIIFSIIHIFTLFKKKKNISWEVNRGLRCYSCLKDLDDVFDFNLKITNETFNLCKSCNRDSKIESISGSNKTKLINSLKRYCYSDKSKNTYIIYLMIVILNSSISFLFIKNKLIFSILSMSINIIYWIFLLYKYRISFIDK